LYHIHIFYQNIWCDDVANLFEWHFQIVLFKNKMASPVTISYRHSDEGIDAWIMNESGRDFKAHNISPTEVHEMLKHLESLRIRSRIHFFNGELRISRPILGPHEAASRFFDSRITLWNNLRYPLDLLGERPVNLQNRGLYQPDSSFQVENRGHSSPNAVVETHFHSNTSISEFNVELRNYIDFTPDVMIVVGVKIYNRQLSGQFSAVFVVYERDVATNRSQLTRLISFGTSILHHNALTSWEESTGGNVIGAVNRGNHCWRFICWWWR